MRIEMFGGLRILGGEQFCLRSRQAEALLALLALSPGRLFSREELAAALWPDADAVTGRSRLKQELAVLRKALRQDENALDILGCVAEGIRLLPEQCDTDVSRFEAELSAAQEQSALRTRIETLERAIGRMRGPLLPGCYVPEILRERERLEQLQVRAFCLLARLRAVEGEMAKAREAARRAVQADPLDLDSRALLLVLLARSGSPAEAGAEFQAYTLLLAQELDDSPAPALHRLAAQCQALNLPAHTLAMLALRQGTPSLHRLLHSLGGLTAPWEIAAAEAASDDPDLLSHLSLLQNAGLLQTEGLAENLCFRLLALPPLPLP